MPIHVISMESTPLLDHDWLHKLRLNWNNLHTLPYLQAEVHTAEAVAALATKYSQLFTDDYGTISAEEATLHLKERCTP